jgi:hypothetical protein
VEKRVPVEHENNLYEWRDGTSTFIATLGGGDDGTGSFPPAGDWAASSSDRTAQVTPDGQYLAFMSNLSLTGYDNTPLEGTCGAESGSVCFEVFQYDSATGRVVCASCNPSGSRPLGDSRLPWVQDTDSVGTIPQPRALSDNGRVFFDSQDALSPYDTNGDTEDVYEWEPDGLGSCAQSDGCVFLISPGTSTSPSSFLGGDPSGENAFFTTRERLVRQDEDDLIDVYDARVNGGFTAPVPPECSGTGCQGIPGSPAIFATPSSVTFNGVGNFTEPVGAPAKPKPKTKTKKPKCAKPKKLAHGKCVKTKHTGKKTSTRKNRATGTRHGNAR